MKDKPQWPTDYTARGFEFGALTALACIIGALLVVIVSAVRELTQ